MRKLLTQKELCELLRIKYSTLYRMMNDGRFEVRPVNGRGNKLLFDSDAVETWIKSRQTPVAHAAGIRIAKNEKKHARDFAERQQRAADALQRHALNRNGKEQN